jgi:hypothetical protein
MKPSNAWALSLDTVLLLVLGAAHLWFNPISSALTLTLMALYVLLNWVAPKMPDEMSAPRARDRAALSFRLFVVLFLLMLAAVLPTLWNIAQRRAEGGGTHAHDGVFQTEAAIEYILNGKNPYVETYWNTPMANWQRGEPPWTDAPIYHNAYLPFLFIGSLPFYWLSHATLGWYDQRFVYLLTYIGVLVLLPLVVVRQRDKLTMLLTFGLNLLAAFYLSEGRNDIVVAFGLLLATVLLARRHVSASALVLGLTLAVKHQAWFFIPFFFVYLLPRPLTWQSVRAVLRQIVPMFLAATVMIAPFLIWDARAFVDDTVLYLMGATEHSFPIKGWGFSTLLLAMGVIPSAEAQFPFGVLEGAFGISTLLLLLRWQWRENTLQRAWIGFAVLSFVVEYFSRFFNDNYVIFVLQALVIGALISPYRWRTEPTDAR